MKKLFLSILALTVLCLAIPSVVDSRRTPLPIPPDNGCSLPFNGSARKAVKLRPTNLNYPLHNNGTPISVKDFLQFVCTLNSQVTKPVPASQAMNVATDKITVRGFVMAMKLDPDN